MFTNTLTQKRKNTTDQLQGVREIKFYFEQLANTLSKKDEHYQFLNKFVDSTRCYAYATRMRDHSIVWVNDSVNKTFGEVIGKSCYRIFQNLYEPCDFCTDPTISQEEGKEYSWVFYNEYLGKVFYITDIMHYIDGEPYRFEKAVDITEHLDTIVKINTKLKNGN